MIDVERILECTFSLYSRYGIKSVAVDDIAMELGMSKKTIYEHFNNRENLIEKAITKNLDDFLENMNQEIDPGKDVFTQLASYYVFIIHSVKKINPSFVHDLKKYSGEQYKAYVEFRNEKLYDIFMKIVQRGIDEGIFQNELESKAVYYNQIEKTSVLIDDYRSEFSPVIISPVLIYRMILNDIRGMTTLKGHVVFEEKYTELLKMIE